MTAFPDHREYFLTTAEVLEAIRPFEDHGHCFGFIAEQAIDTVKRQRAAEANRRSRCPNTATGEHELQFPRMEDSIDRDRGKTLPPVYCRLCLTPIKPALETPPLMKRR